MFKYINFISSCKNILLEKVKQKHEQELIKTAKNYFSKRFFDKRSKIKDYLIKEKEHYKSILYKKKNNENEMSKITIDDSKIVIKSKKLRSNKVMKLSLNFK